MKGKVKKPKVKDEPAYLTLNEVGKLLKLRVGSLLKLKKDKGFPIVEIGAHTHRVRRDSIEKWIESQERKE